MLSSGAKMNTMNLVPCARSSLKATRVFVSERRNSKQVKNGGEVFRRLLLSESPSEIWRMIVFLSFVSGQYFERDVDWECETGSRKAAKSWKSRGQHV